VENPQEEGQAVDNQPAKESEKMGYLDGIDDEKKERVNFMLALMLREMTMRLRVPTWPEKAVEVLPGDVLDALLAAKTKDEIIAVIKPYVGLAIGLQLKLKLADEKNQQWFVEGFEIMKQVASGEDEEGEEGEPGDEIGA
jgi:hypothetical protein